jgi:hypothetical protein
VIGITPTRRRCPLLANSAQLDGRTTSRRPLIQRHMVSIPPAVMLPGIAAFTYLFGMIAVIFAAAIVVVIFAAVNLPYVRDTLGEKPALIRKLW